MLVEAPTGLSKKTFVFVLLCCMYAHSRYFFSRRWSHLWITLVFPTPASPTTRILITGDVSAAADIERVSLVDVEKRKCFAKKPLSRYTGIRTYVCTRKNDVTGVREAPGPQRLIVWRLDLSGLSDVRQKKVSSAVNSVYTHDAPALSLHGLVVAPSKPGAWTARANARTEKISRSRGKQKKVKPINEKTIQF